MGSDESADEAFAPLELEGIQRDVESYLYNDRWATGPVGSAIGVGIVVALLRDEASTRALTIWAVLGLGTALVLLIASRAKQLHGRIDGYGVPMAVNVAAACTGLLYGSLVWVLFDDIADRDVQMTLCAICLGISTTATSGRAGVGGQGRWVVWPMWLAVIVGLAIAQQWILVALLVAFVLFLYKSLADTSGIVLEVLVTRGQAKRQANLAYQASLRDPLTGALNRTGLHTKAKQYRAVGYVAYFIDLDDFKVINDGLGHHVGDQVLKSIAKSLKEMVGSRGLVGRFGGDEFIVVIAGKQSAEDQEETAERIAETVNAPIIIGTDELSVGATVGVATSDEGVDFNEIQRNADRALNWAKAHHKGQSIRFAHPEVRALPSTSELREAIDDGSIGFWAQPVVNSSTGKVVMVELLARWNNGGGNVRTAAEFIPYVHQSGLSTELLERTMTTAAQTLVRWGLDPRFADLAVSINVDARQIDRDLVFEQLKAVTRAHGVAPDLFVFEILRSTTLRGIRDLDSHIQRLRSTGARVAVDDFGSGHSQLDLVVDLSLDIVKVDRSLIARHDQELVRTVLGAVKQICEASGCEVLAEGIEHPWQFHMLRELGVEYGQGFILAPPMPMADVDDFITINAEALATQHRQADIRR